MRVKLLAGHGLSVAVAMGGGRRHGHQIREANKKCCHDSKIETVSIQGERSLGGLNCQQEHGQIAQ